MSARSSSSRTFRLAFTAVILVLALACAGLLAVAGSQGPRLVRTDVDPLAVVQQSRQRLVLSANRPIAPVDASRIQLTPATDFTVDTQADRIILDFPRPLSYDADYTVTIGGVQGVGGGPSSDLRTAFRTGDPGMLVLVRGDARTPDRIERQVVVGSGASDVVFQAPRIQEYAVVGKTVVVATLEGDGTNKLMLAALDGSVEGPLALPGTGTLEDLHAQDTGTTVGLRFTSSDGRYRDALMIGDVTAGAVSTPAVGLDGSGLGVRAWGFVPGRPQLVVQDMDGDISLVTIDGSAPIVPLGRHATLGPFSSDGTRLAVTDPGTTTEIDLRGSDRTARPTATGDESGQDDGAIAFVPGDEDALLRVRTARDPATGALAQRLVLERNDAATDVYTPADAATRITGLSVTPNGQYAVLETVPDPTGGASDGYPRNSRDSTVTTLLVDLATGTITRSVAGFAIVID